MLALGYSGEINVDIFSLLKGHIYLVFVGYVGITIIGMSLILLPMFWLSHSFSQKYVTYALYLLCVSIFLVVVSSLFDIEIFANIGYVGSILAFLLYFYQIYIIFNTKVRVEKDVYYYSMQVSYISMLVSLILGIYYLIFPEQNILFTLGWVLFVGFIGFVIIGHLYKIVPFLVWYQRFSPLIGKQKVPMLADMVPTKSAKVQFVFNLTGLIIVSLGLFLLNNKGYFPGR